MLGRSIAVVLFGVVAAYVLHIMNQGHFFEKAVPFNIENCHFMKKGADACESLGLHKPSGTVILACSSRAKRTKWWPAVAFWGNGSAYHLENDGLFKYDPKNDKLVKLDMQGLKGEFHAHGIGILDDGDQDEVTIMAVNHRTPGSVIEIFTHRVGTNTVKHVETVSSPLIKSPNSVVPVSKSSFYVTNDVMAKQAVLRKIEVLLKLPTGNVVLRKPSGELQVVAKNIKYANGITLSSGRDLLFVASSTAPEVLVYARNERTGSLTYKEAVPLDFIVDNLWTEPDTGAIFATGMWHAFDYLWLEMNASDPSRVVASKVARIVNNTEESRFFGKNFMVEPVLLTPGSFFSDAVTTVYDKATNKAIMGSIYNDGILVCDKFL